MYLNFFLILISFFGIVFYISGGNGCSNTAPINRVDAALAAMPVSKLRFLHKHRSSQDYKGIAPETREAFKAAVVKQFAARKAEIAQHELIENRKAADLSRRNKARSRQQKKQFQKYGF